MKESIPLKARALRFSTVAMTGVVALAVVILALVIYAGPSPHAPLPQYTLTIEGNPPPGRPGYPEVDRLSFIPGGQVTITARPSEPVHGKFDVIAAVSLPHRAGGSYYPLSPDVARDGTITLSGTTDVVFDGVVPGSYQLGITIQRPGRRADEPGGTVELKQDVMWRGGEAL